MSESMGPFVVQERAGATGTYWIAVDPASGIGRIGFGRDERGRALADRDALNAAWRLGRNAGRAEGSAAREIDGWAGPIT